MKAKACRLVAAGALAALVGSPVLAAPANKLTNGGFEDPPHDVGSFPAICCAAPLTTTSTKNEWSAGQNFESVLGSLSGFPIGWGGDYFAEHNQEFTGGSSDVTDMIRQAIVGDNGSTHNIVANVPVHLSFKYIQAEGGREVIVQVYGLDAGSEWSQFASWNCSNCTLLYEATLQTPYDETPTWHAFSGSFTPSATHDTIAIGFQLGGHDGYERGIDDVVLTQNQPPDCSQATPSVATLWAANLQFVPINVSGVTDPDGDTVTIQVTSIYQDEPVHEPGSGNTSPDGQGVGTATAKVRAERAGGGDGRVYHIGFTADDGNGGTCDGTVKVSVPKSQGTNGAAVDEGALYDSTTA